MEIAAIILAFAMISLTIIFFFILNNRSQSALDNTRRQYEEQIAALNQRLNEQTMKLNDSMNEQTMRLNERINEQVTQLNQRAQLEFRALAEDILSGKEKSLNEENRRQLDEILSPLRSNIDNFKKAVESYYIADNRDKGALTQQLQELIVSNTKIGEEARRLSNALSSNNKVQGQWGETVLETMLNKAGLKKGTNYLTQVNKDGNGLIVDDNDRAQKPDFIILLPDDHKVVIDSKVSLTDYIRYIEAENDAQGQAALKRHTDSVRKHIDELARKQYHKNIAGAMEHTLMFIPNDAAYIASVTFDASLWDYAYKHNVVMVSGTHLLSVLQIIRQLWRVENQNRNAEEIARVGGLLFDKLVSFMGDFNDIRRHIDATSKAFEKCVTHIEHSSVGLMARAQKLHDLGSKTTKKLNG